MWFFGNKYALALLAAFFTFSVVVSFPWIYIDPDSLAVNWKLLDLEDLRGDWLGALLDHHSFGLLINVFYVLALKCGRHYAWFVVICKSALALGGLAFLYSGARRIGASPRIASCVCLLLLLGPMYWIYLRGPARGAFMLLLIPCLLYCTIRALNDQRWIIGVGMSLVGMSLVRSHYHPVFGVLYLFVLISLRWSPRALVLALVCSFMLFGYSAKNWLRLGSFTHGTIDAFNHVYLTPILDEWHASYWSYAQDHMGAGRRTLYRPVRSGLDTSKGVCIQPHGNWGHQWFLETKSEWIAKAFAWKKENPGHVIGTALVNYLYGARAAHVEPYTSPKPKIHEVWKTVAKWPLFVEFRVRWLDAHIKRLEPLGWTSLVSPAITPYAFVFPVIMIWSLIISLKRRKETLYGLCILCVAMTVWIWGTAMFSSGVELARMRYPIAPAFWVSVAVVINWFGVRLGGWKAWNRHRLQDALHGDSLSPNMDTKGAC